MKGHTKKPSVDSAKVYEYLKTHSDGEKIKKIYDFSIGLYDSGGIYVIARIQKKKSIGISVVNGEINDISSSSRNGIGVHAFDKNGASAMVSSNTFPEVDFEELVGAAKNLIASSAAYDIKKNADIYKLEAQINIIDRKYPHPFESYELSKIIEKTVEVNKKIREIDKSRLSVSTNCTIVTDEFIIIRGDKTFSAFGIPRAAVSNAITAKDGLATATVGARLGSSDLSVLFDAEIHGGLMKQSELYAREVLNLLTAPRIDAGRYRVVIDYALAKGLAHEAFGHAAEADLHKGSILWKDGHFIKGERVAGPEVSIIDGPIFNDYAWQPVGANGNLRNEVAIVAVGVVEKSLSDIFSSADAGVSNENAERIEGFDCPSIPRMTNIRLEYRNPVKVNKSFYEITPSELNGILKENGLLAPEGETLLLAGYKGGQVSPSEGDFVFNCSMIYKMNQDCVPVLYKPAIFAGKTLSALKSIIGAVGPVKSDALGTCGKNGQGVPSSGGANYFMVIDRNENITIG